MFVWDNKKYPFDIMDADMMQVFDTAEKELWASLNDYESANAKDGRINAEGVKAECRMIDTFFESIFGEGKPKEMFDSRFNLAERTKAVKKLYNLRESQLEEHNLRVEKLSSLVFSGDRK
mgnify:CR=1 FL=1